MAQFIYNEVEECWQIIIDQQFSTLEKAKEYLESTSPNCKGEKYCQCNCGLHKENGDY